MGLSPHMTVHMLDDIAKNCLSAPTDRQVEAAARAWMEWQFPGRSWDDAVPELRGKFLVGARVALLAAADVLREDD